MDMRGWKRVLLQWVTECGFMEGNYFSLEQTDIDEFYKNFRLKHKMVLRTESRCNLIAFIREHYNNFKPHMDDENSLSSNDYVYVYSLLLHFCCVKYPEAQFHDICQRLSGMSQRYIAAYFKELIDCPIIDRERLRYAIANVAGKQAGNSSENASSNSSNSSGLQSSGFGRMESPVRHCHYAPGNTVPPTPKSALLEERTRELYNLRALLETERYEKGLLEVQIKQNEEKILKLNHDHRKLHQQIQDLKNDILTKNMEPSTPSRDGDDQMRRRLCKEIQQKEQEIAKLNEVLGGLREDKCLAQEKLLYAEKQITACVERIKELDYKVDELIAELEQKENTIRCLNESKSELEQFILESRSVSNNSRPEYLDASFSPITDSSSPENLGRSVVDVQLREKEHENSKLREELSTMNERNSRLKSQIQNFVIKHSQELNIATAIGSVAAKEEDEGNTQPSEYLTHMIDYVERLGNNYKDDRLKLKNMQADLLAKQKRNDELTRKVQEFEKEVSTLKESMKSVELVNSELEQSKRRLQEKVVRCEQEIVKINEQKFDLVAKLESLANDYDVHKENWGTQHQNFVSEIAKLEKELERRDKDCVKLSSTNDNLTEEIHGLENKVQALQQSLKTSSEEIKSLNERFKGRSHELESYEKTEKMLKEKYEKLLVQHEAMRRDKRETSEHLEAMRNSIAVKELEMNKLGTEIIEVRKKNVELELRIDTLMTEYKNEKKNSDLVINARDERIREIGKERDLMQEQLEKSNSQLGVLQTQFSAQKGELNSMLAKIHTLSTIVHGEKCDDVDNPLESLADIVNMVKELQECKVEASTKIEMLNFDKTEAITRAQEIEDQLKRIKHEKQALLNKRDQQLSDLRKDLQYLQEKTKVYEEQIECLKSAQTKCAEDLRMKMKMKDEECALHLQQIADEHARTVRAYDNDLRSTKELLILKTQEMEEICEECDEAKQKLSDGAKQLEELQQLHAEAQRKNTDRLMGLERKIEQLAASNHHFMKEINTFKEEHTKVEQRLKDADKVLNLMTDQLHEEISCKSELTSRLESSESRLLETELKLDNIMKEKSDTISGLKTAYESQATVLKRAEGHIALLEKTKAKQAQAIVCMQQTLDRITDEKDRLTRDVTAFSSQIQCEQDEKSALLCSLEQTADQLKSAIDQKDQQVSTLEKNCADLRQQLDAAHFEHTRLQNELMNKESQLRCLREDHERERDDWQTKLSDWMRKLTEQSIEREVHDTMLMKITTVVENNANVQSLVDGENHESDFLTVDENESDTNVGRLKLALNRLLHSMLQLHTQLAQTEQKRQGAVEVLEKANDKLNSQLLARKTDIAELQLQLTNERKQCKEAELIKTERDELKKQEAEFMLQIQQLKRDCESAEQRQQSTLATMERLEREKLEMKGELQRANENVTRLIQGNESMRQEKEGVVEELQQLRKQLERACELQSIAEAKLKSLTESSESFEQKMVTAENELAELRAQMQISQRKRDELHAENAKLMEAQQATTKRIEKLAVKLGDTQARCAKLEHDNEKLTESVAGTKTNAERLEREKSQLENEKRSLQERLVASEHSQHQFNIKAQLLEQKCITLAKEKQLLAASELDAKTKLMKLEKIRQANEEKLRKLNYDLETSECTNVRLNHEIGAINSELSELKNAASAERAEHLEEVTKQRDEALTRAREYEALTQKLQAEAGELREQNTNIGDQLSKVSVSLQISQTKCEQLVKQLHELETDMTKLRAQKEQAEAEHMSTCAKLEDYEVQSELLLAQKRDDVAALEAQIAQLKAELAEKAQEITVLQKERDSLRDSAGAETTEMECLRRRLAVAEAMVESEQKSSSQLRLDNQILQAKYRESKQRLLDEAHSSEERIKENRLEMEGKLDKMKNKMKTLYTEEITKMKAKQEREVATMKSELDVLKNQNGKFEEHIRKLSSQIVRLNERILEHQKQNAILSTKLRHLQESDGAQFKRPGTLPVGPTVSSTTITASGACSGPGGTSLAMEDEEGEVFNNTYLTDLQTGRMSMCRDVCAEELQYRNSLLPPHLKSTYAAQYDHGLAEDELKDGPHSLDDSMIGLLSTTASSARARKLTGITNYKRPGPPTPGKHGGRLSLGGVGSSEPPREILKESNDGGGGSGTSKTPVRFGFFASRFSMGNGTAKDEAQLLEPSQSAAQLAKSVQQQDFNSICLAGAVCTSTPRKSRPLCDQRCLPDQCLPLPAAPQLLSLAVGNYSKTPAALCLANVSNIRHERAPPSHLKMLEQQRVARKRRSSLLRQRIGRRLRQIMPTTPTTTPSSVESQTPADGTIGTTTCTTTTTTPATASSSDALPQTRPRRRPKRDRGPRLSLYTCGRNGATYCTPSRVNMREQMRRKAHKQRLDNYNKTRMLAPDRGGTVRGSAGVFDLLSGEDVVIGLGNNNQDNNKTLSNQRRLSATIVLSKGQREQDSVVCEADSLCEADRGNGGAGLVRLSGGQLDASSDLDGSCHVNAANELSQLEDVEHKSQLSIFLDDSNNVFGDGNESRTDVCYPLELRLSNEEFALCDDLRRFEKCVERFEQVLNEKESHAPFEVNDAAFDFTASPAVFTQFSPASCFAVEPQTAMANSSQLPQIVCCGQSLPNMNVSCALKLQDNRGENLESISLHDLLRLLATIWARMDDTMRLAMIFVVFAPMFAIVSWILLSFN